MLEPIVRTSSVHMLTMRGNLSVLLLCFLITRQRAEPCKYIGSVWMCPILSDLELTAAAEQIRAANVHIDIDIPLLNLTKSVTFKHLYSLTINGNPRSPSAIYCIQSGKYPGIKFHNVTNLWLKNLKLTNCGSLIKSRSKNYNSALVLLYCHNVEMRNLLLIENQGIGLTIINHQEGKINISGSNFTKNKLPQELEGRIYGGGGVYIQFHRNYNLSGSIEFNFDHCLFDKNVAYTRLYQSLYTDEFGEERTGYGRGGGVFLEFESSRAKQSSLTVSFSYCIFTKNQAFLGGGLSVNIGRGRNSQISTKIIVTVKNSVFDSNGCNGTRIGGGVHLAYNLNFKSVGVDYKLQNVKITNNCAELGGGFFFFSNIWRSSSNHSLLFDKCTFERNRAHIGSAIDMNPNSFTRLLIGHTAVVPLFKNCKFIKNKVQINSGSNGTQRIAGVGTVYSSLYDIEFLGRNHFENNRGTAVYVVNGNANFSASSVTFKNNQGVRGGAIALIGLSSMTVGPKRKYLFMNNRAVYQGGAIFTLMIDTHDFTLSKSCFIQYNNGTRPILTKLWKNNITFIGNKAPFGPAIFATSLHPCQLIKDGKYYHSLNASQVFSIHGIHINESEVATEGAQLHREHDMLYAIPGKQYNHGVTIMDDTSNNVVAPLRADVTNRKVKLDPVLSSYVGEKVQLRGKPGEKSSLSLQTVSTRQSYTTFMVKLVECPPGFKLDRDSKCICNANAYFGLADYCDYDNFQTYLTPGLWAGLINDQEMVTSICPRSFCDYRDDQTKAFGIVLPHKSSDLDKTICGETRTGILCGSCRPGYTVHFHSPKYLCKPIDTNLCKFGWLFYIISELVPVTVVFITVIAFNISFTSGAVNGFILFSQILLSLNIDASGIITFPNQRPITEGYQLLYGFLNLDFFTTETMSFCLWPNATALDMLAFKYITIVYALSLVILVIWFMNKCGGKCFRNCCRITTVKSFIIHGISAFLIICYSQSILVSHSLVNGIELWSKEGSNTTIAKRVWLNGNMIYWSRSHLSYALPALLCLLTIGILPPVLLISYPLLNKILSFCGVEESKLVTFISQKLPISSFKPLLDCFQGCFKDNLRFFAGLYFLYRWIAPVVYTTASSLGTAYIMTEISLILILAIHAFSHPYIKGVHNMVDTILFTDLLLINSITCIHYFLFQSQENQYTVNKKVAITAKIQATLIYLPFIAMIIYILLLGAKQMYGYWYMKYGHHLNLEERNTPLSKTLQGKLRAAVHSTMFSDGNRNEQELPYRLFTGSVSNEQIEDTY